MWEKYIKDSYHSYAININAPQLLLSITEQKSIPFDKIQWLKDGEEIRNIVVKEVLDKGINYGLELLKKINIEKMFEARKKELKNQIENRIDDLSKCKIQDFKKILENRGFCNLHYQLSFFDEQLAKELKNKKEKIISNFINLYTNEV